MHDPPRMSLRKSNCYKIAQAFSHTANLEVWVKWVDPLSAQSEYNRSHLCMPHADCHTFHVKGHTVHVPLEWYWREISDWEIQSLVTEWALSQP